MEKNVVNVIMPMLGGGTRMQGVQKTCKPLMKLPNGEHFFVKALSSLRNYHVSKLVLLVLEEYADEFRKSFEYDLPFDELKVVPHCPTNSPVESLMVGLQYVDDDLPLFSLDCDIFAEIPLVELSDDVFGKLFTFNDTIGNKSYVTTTKDGYVLNVEEKRMISNDAVFGSYLFIDVKKMKRYVENAGYLSQIFKNALHSGERVSAERIEGSVKMFGTLEELLKYGAY
jgi:NDP-sugar pyrophosphorylase family protein